MSADPTFESIINQVKVDVVSPTHDVDNARQLELASRCFAIPTKEMYEYATKASLGDAVFHDPSTQALETHMAQLTGKEAALLVASGTMSNQLAIRTHLRQPPFSVVCDGRSHINKYESGGAALHTGAHLIPIVPSNRHHLTLKDISPHVVLGEDIHSAPTRLICLENTVDGLILPQSDIVDISQFAHENNILVHLDGARLWHVAATTNTPMSVLCAPFDSVSLCFSKGLGAPMGTCLVGSKAFIQKAKWFRKAFGGGMRQTGIIAAAIAVHALAKCLEQGLRDLGVRILSPAETCILFYDPSPIGIGYQEVQDSAAALPRPITDHDFLALLRTLKEKMKDGVDGVTYPPGPSGTDAKGGYPTAQF
ncbi:pyridoxal phosphate-dependent transferase [Pisolithus microcarpus]|nr:pyridoxal phosphate-dependent transferase [Pisolithus microcarpus]